ncbi:DUF4145 domain-containing protein [Streptomyces sp. NBC_00474]|uniref:DUF4145 domain-containing protein n=1 Tax=Streptomyces sp. NBC_00474 TaxID=2975754 RepID=UPI00225832B4|nr:DUF4145 domain-containing protein [Streptomyces sp. NBC_00474]MCX5049331.1 DUF4145 domain-containing protein [Streptomyces sp. NBC_00474]
MTKRFNKLDGFTPLGRSVAGECPHCVRHTTLICTAHATLDGSGSEGDDLSVARCLVTLRCHWCSKESAYLRLVAIELKQFQGTYREVFKTTDLEQIWPSKTPRELAPEAPETAREVFAEAARAEAAGAFRLAGIGYRAAVEQIVKERGAGGKNLFDRITGLKDLGATQDIVDAFHEARFVGNDAAHDALAYSAEEIADIAELIDEAVIVLYVQPAQRAKMATQRAARRRGTEQPTP